MAFFIGNNMANVRLSSEANDNEFLMACTRKNIEFYFCFYLPISDLKELLNFIVFNLTEYKLCIESQSIICII